MGHIYSSALLMLSFSFSVSSVTARSRTTVSVFNSSSHVFINKEEETQLLSPLLPIWATNDEEEKEMYQRAWANENNNLFKQVKRQKRIKRQQPQQQQQQQQQQQRVKQQQEQQQRTTTQTLRIPAEYEPISTVIMAYDPRYNDLTFSMIRSIQEAGSHAWLLVKEGTNLQSLEFLNVQLVTVNFNSVWTRDYGPIAGIIEQSTTGESNSSNSSRVVVDPVVYRLGHVRPLDEQVPCHMSQHFKDKVACHSTSIVIDGGNLMFDGRGNLFTTTVTYIWNQHLTREQVNNELMTVFNVDKIHALDYAKEEKEEDSERAADGTGHLDMFAKILAPCVVIVAEAPPNNHSYYTVLNQAATYFASLPCQAVDGSTSFYQVHRIPGWEDQNNNRWYTYTNSLIVNDRVIVPSYSSAVDNDVARQVDNTAAPHLTVDFVHSEIAIQQGGAIHCLTRDIPRLITRQLKSLNATRA